MPQTVSDLLRALDLGSSVAEFDADLKRREEANGRYQELKEPRVKDFPPGPENIVALSGDTSEVSGHLQLNVQRWCWVTGAFGMLKDETLTFYSQLDYWYGTDGGIVAAYLHRRRREPDYPAADLRVLAQYLLRAFERKEASGGLGEPRGGRAGPGFGVARVPGSLRLGRPRPPKPARARNAEGPGAVTHNRDAAEAVLQFFRDIEGLAGPKESDQDLVQRIIEILLKGRRPSGGFNGKGSRGNSAEVFIGAHSSCQCD